MHHYIHTFSSSSAYNFFLLLMFNHVFNAEANEINFENNFRIHWMRCNKMPKISHATHAIAIPLYNHKPNENMFLHLVWIERCSQIQRPRLNSKEFFFSCHPSTIENEPNSENHPKWMGYVVRVCSIRMKTVCAWKSLFGWNVILDMDIILFCMRKLL